MNNLINNLKSESDILALSEDVCIGITHLNNEGIEIYLYYDGRGEQLITLSKEQKEELIKKLLI